MLPLKVYHASINANTPYTFDMDVDCSAFLIKNLGTDPLHVSFGDAIDNDAYVIVMPKTAEVLYSTAVTTPESETNQVTVLSIGNCDVEIRLLEF